MKSRDPLKSPSPPVTGFHKRNIATFVAIAVVVLAAAIYILTRGEDAQIVRTEPRIPRRPELPPATLLEEPPPAPADPRLFEPPLPAGPPPVSLPPEPPRLYVQALRSPIASSQEGKGGAEARRSSGPMGGTPEFLETALRDLERQGRRLERFQSSFGGLLPGATPPGPAQGGRASPAGSSAAAEVRFTRAATSYRLDQGTLLEAQLLTAIDSHLPGQILAQVTHDVFDSATLRSVLIPKGSRLLGRYDQDLAFGQNRLLVAWNRILFPDATSLVMPAQPGVDPQGRAGLRDRVNHHLVRLFGHAALLSLIGAGFELSQPAGAGDRGRLAITGASRELELAATQLLRNRGSIPPTIKIRPGLRFHVLLNRDLDFDTPYGRS